jgi:hypothetical protein
MIVDLSNHLGSFIMIVDLSNHLGSHRLPSPHMRLGDCTGPSEIDEDGNELYEIGKILQSQGSGKKVVLFCCFSLATIARSNSRA